MKVRTIRLAVLWPALMRWGVLSASLILAIFLNTGCNGTTANINYEFTNIRRATVERTVSSSGTIHPVSTVKVVPQMSGKVEKILIDYNDEVRRGQVLAELNTDVLKLKQQQQNAAVNKTRANYELQQINYSNQEALAAKSLISEYELRQSKNQLDSLAAELTVAESNLRVIETEINQYAFITSPIEGIVLDRNINIGDTVVEGTSNIFTIAENLRDMQIEANVGELDVSSIHRGQEVRFTLESLPGRTFSGMVENVRMVPVVISNVVSYTVIISAQNPDGSLMPGMTCAVEFIVERYENVLTVSNAALRYEPTALSADKIEEMVFYASIAGLSEAQQQAAIEARQQALTQSTSRNTGNSNNNNSIQRLLTGGGNNRTTTTRSAPGQGSRTTVVTRNIWYMNSEGKFEVMQVQTGVSNGSVTELISMDNLEGMQVILRERL